MTARPSPSLPRNTQQQKPGPCGSCEHWRRTRNHCPPPPWPASWPNQAGAGNYCPPTTTRCIGTKQAGHVERAGRERNGRGRPAIIWRITTAGRGWLDDHDKAPDLAAAATAEAQRKTEQARRAAAERDQALDEARATFDLQTPRISRKRAAHRLRELGCTLEQIGAVFHVSKERIRQDLLWDPAARKPRRKPKPPTRLSPGQTQLLLGLSLSGSALKAWTL